MSSTQNLNNNRIHNKFLVRQKIVFDISLRFYTFKNKHIIFIEYKNKEEVCIERSEQLHVCASENIYEKK